MYQQFAPKTVLAIDWSASDNWCSFLNDQDEVVSECDTDALIEVIKKYVARGYRTILIESTFESYDLQEHNHVVNYCAEHDITLLQISPRETAHYRQSKAWEKTDEIDSKCILHMFLDGKKHFHAARRWDTENVKHGEISQFNRYLARVRARGWHKGSKNYNDEKVIVALDHFRRIEQLGNFAEEFGDENGKNFSMPFLMPILLTAIECSSRDEFEKRLGLYGNGYPTMLRSNFYHSRVKTLVKRSLKPLYGKVLSLQKEIPEEKLGPVRKDIMKKLRKACRYLYSVVKNPSKFTKQDDSNDFFEFSNS